MKFAVTGGAGFIGSNIVRLLIRHTDAEIVIVDPYSASSAYANFPPDGFRVSVSEADIRDEESLTAAFRGVNTVFHCAAYSKIADCEANKHLAYAVNVRGTMNVLLAAEKAKVRRVVYSSSASVYGKSRDLPLKEDAKPDLINVYAATKFLGESLCERGQDIGGVETVCLRYFNVFGSIAAISGLAPCPSVVEVFLKQRFAGKPLTVIGKGGQKRDFVHVYDVAMANFLAMQSAKVGRGESINIGSGENHRISDIAKLVGGPVESVPERYAETAETLADISRAKELLGWQPKTRVADWINMTR